MTAVRTVTTGLAFPEGPIALANGDVLVVEIRRGTLTRVAPDGTTGVVAELGGGPNGAAIGPDGAVYVCNNGGFTWHDRDGITAPGHQPADYRGGSIQRVGPDGTVTDLYTACDGRPLRGPNDIVFDADGGFWFTDIGKSRERDRDTGALYHARPDGSSITEVVHPLTQPNGVGLSPDGSRLYVAETVTGRVWSWPVLGPGRLGPAALLHGLGGYQMLDSLAVDGDGNVCVATPGDRGDQRDRARRHAAAPGPGARARPVRHQHLLRRVREPHGLGHLLRTRHPLLAGVGHRGARPGVHGMKG